MMYNDENRAINARTMFEMIQMQLEELVLNGGAFELTMGQLLHVTFGDLEISAY
jgi:hypothetical protein